MVAFEHILNITSTSSIALLEYNIGVLNNSIVTLESLVKTRENYTVYSDHIANIFVDKNFILEYMKKLLPISKVVTIEYLLKLSGAHLIPISWLGDSSGLTEAQFLEIILTERPQLYTYSTRHNYISVLHDNVYNLIALEKTYIESRSNNYNLSHSNTLSIPELSNTIISNTENITTVVSSDDTYENNSNDTNTLSTDDTYIKGK